MKTYDEYLKDIFIKDSEKYKDVPREYRPVREMVEVSNEALVTALKDFLEASRPLLVKGRSNPPQKPDKR